MTPSSKRLRIACSGVVAADHGSVASAGYEVLVELLARGHEIDFYSKRNYVYPATLIGEESLRYIDCSQPRLDGLIGRLGPKLFDLGVNIGHKPFTRRIVQAMRRGHLERPYDVELFLGQWAYGRIPGIPVVSWLQGPPGTDARSIRRHRRDIVRLCGLAEYVLLQAYAICRTSGVGRPACQHTDVSICGSRESARALVENHGLESSGVRTLPYPIDLTAFAPDESARRRNEPLELLWVGRVVPRKRLDLFLDAGAALIAVGWDIHLAVIGSFAFAHGYEQLLKTFPYPERLTHVPRLPREEVLLRLQSATLLIQPSEDENFGSSVAEALACGTPVIVGPTNGTADYIGAGGIKYPRDTVDCLVAATARMLYELQRDPRRVAADARRAAVDHFSVGRVVDGLESIMHAASRTVG